MAAWTATTSSKDAATAGMQSRSVDAAIPSQSGLVKAAPVGARTSTVLLYLALGTLALVPGLLIKFERLTGLPFVDAELVRLQAVLSDIRFGSGARFWSGVAGATMMGLLLLYPLRKLWPNARWLGRVASWFNIHLLFGVAGPVAILYHCNFGFGGANANMALWAMGVVTASGIAGHFVHASISAGFYARQRTARQERDALADLLNQINVFPNERDTLLAQLDAVDAALLTPRRGVVASLSARLTLERARAQLARDLGSYITAAGEHLQLDRARHEQIRLAVADHFGGFIALARAASSRSVREQVWARWRLFHLPVFLIMTVAAGLHIYAVWDMDSPSATAADARVEPQTSNPTLVRAPAPARAAKAAEPKTPDTQAKVKAAAPASAQQTAQMDAPQPKAEIPAEPQKKAVAKAPTPLPKTAPAFDLEPLLVDTPRTATRPSLAEKPAAQDTKSETGVVARAAPTPPREPIVPTLPSDTEQILAELQRRTTEQPMSLGGAKPRTLAEQIATLKERQRAGTFSHSDGETGFALIGKHRNVDCASCHTKPLKETRSESPRACVTCHKEDDVHRGRRPDCAQCHTPTRWSDVKKRR